MERYCLAACACDRTCSSESTLIRTTSIALYTNPDVAKFSRGLKAAASDQEWDVGCIITSLDTESCSALGLYTAWLKSMDCTVLFFTISMTREPKRTCWWRLYVKLLLVKWSQKRARTSFQTALQYCCCPLSILVTWVFCVVVMWLL
jgi:hypothetical protein